MIYDSVGDEWIRKDPDYFSPDKIGEETEKQKDDFLHGKGSFEVI